MLLESTGLEGHSDIRSVDRATGRMLQRVLLPDSEFGEGIASIGNRVYQLTWQSGRGRVYDARTLAAGGLVPYDGEGWGLASDDTLLYLTDGTSGIRVIDPNGFRVVRRIRVTEAGKAVHMLNELEWVRGELWANVYETDVHRAHRSGDADASSDGSISRQLLPEAQRERLKDRGGVANGIAYDRATGRVLVTGKYWPYLFQLDSIPGARDSIRAASPARDPLSSTRHHPPRRIPMRLRLWLSRAPALARSRGGTRSGRASRRGRRTSRRRSRSLRRCSRSRRVPRRREGARLLGERHSW